MKAADIKKICALGGGGVIGSSWCTNFLWKGYAVTVYDVNDDALALAKKRITANLEYLAEKKDYHARSIPAGPGSGILYNRSTEGFAGCSVCTGIRSRKL